MIKIDKIKSSNRKYNILFISTDFNYFNNDNASFNRMYENLMYFRKHNDFNVIVLQPYRNRIFEKNEFKKEIKTYYYREIKILGNNLVLFIDFNPFFILKTYKIIKQHKIDLIHIEFVYGINCLRLFRKIPVSYNAHNVESIFSNQVGKYIYRIPKKLWFIFTMYIYLIEKLAVKYVKNINAISANDKKKFIEIYRIKKEKITTNSLGYKKEFYYNSKNQTEARRRLKVDLNKFIAIFHGSYYSNYANQEAINIIKDKIAPQIKDEDILFLIAGKMPNFKNSSNLKYLGYLDDLTDFLYSADIAIVPILRGSGIKTKIIDYLSAYLPIITTKKGAEGLPIKSGIHGYIIDDAVIDSIEKILELKSNREKLMKFKENIKKLIIDSNAQANILEIVANRYKNIIESARK